MINDAQNHKLPKVVKRIASLADGKIPRDDEFHIKSRATEIVNKWQQLFHPNGLPSAPIKEDEVKPTAVETTTTTGTKADDAMQVDEPAPAKEVEAAVETVTAAEKEEVAVPAEPAPVAEMEKPIESTATDAASTAIDTTGDAVAPSGEPSAAV